MSKISKSRYAICLMALLLSLSTGAKAATTAVAYAANTNTDTDTSTSSVSDTESVTDDSYSPVTDSMPVYNTDDSWNGIDNFPDEDGYLRYWMADLEEGKGSLSLSYFYDDENVALSDAEISIYRIADISVKNGDAVYTVLDGYGAFEYAGADVDSLNEYAKSQMGTAKSKGADQTAITDSEGKVEFKDLDYGMYLVLETNKSGVASEYYDFTPFIVNVPFPVVDETKYQGEWNYTVEVEPKTEITKVPETPPDSSSQPPTTTTTDNPHTGSMTDVGLYTAASIIFGIIAISMLVSKKRDDDETEENV